MFVCCIMLLVESYSKVKQSLMTGYIWPNHRASRTRPNVWTLHKTSRLQMHTKVQQFRNACDVGWQETYIWYGSILDDPAVCRTYHAFGCCSHLGCVRKLLPRPSGPNKTAISAQLLWQVLNFERHWLNEWEVVNVSSYTWFLRCSSASSPNKQVTVLGGCMAP